MNSPVKLDRSRVQIKVGELVFYQEEEFKIIQVPPGKEVIAVSLKNNLIKTLLIRDLKHLGSKDIETLDHATKDMSHITTKEWDIALQRIDDIRPIINGETVINIAAHAKKIGINQSTLYRWFNRYQEAGGIYGLLPKKEGRKKGTSLISPQAESVIEEVIKEYYLTPQKPKIETVIQRVASKCLDLNIKVPGKNTIRRRIKNVNEYARLSAHEGKSIAQDKFRPAPSHYKTNYPLEVVQIDHTPVDLILVDKESRQPIGRPWITVAIDIYSRMIHGYYLSLDAPSATSVSMCIVNAVQSKDELLANFKIDAEWNISGFMDTIHVDNGADFRSEALMKGCEVHGIDLNYRPVGKSYFGGHIERAIGTLMGKVHNIPGSTFRNVQQKGKYDSEKNSIMTFEEFERWVILFITKLYHKEPHRGIGMTPEEKFYEGVWGTKNSPGSGLRPNPSDGKTILLDFLPFFKRTIQKNGINIDGINYYDSVLRGFIAATDKKKKEKKKFIIKRDPRDISHVWFYDEDLQEYYQIPYANQSLPAISVGELLELRKRIRERSGNRKVYDADLIKAHEEMDEQIKNAEKLTKKERRKKEKKRISTVKKESVSNSNLISPLPANMDNEDDDLWDDDDIPDFDIK